MYVGKEGLRRRKKGVWGLNWAMELFEWYSLYNSILDHKFSEMGPSGHNISDIGPNVKLVYMQFPWTLISQQAVNNKEYMLAADDEDSMNQWLDLIHKCMEEDSSAPK